MPFTVTDILYGGAMPAFVAGLLMLILRWLLPDAFEKRYTVVIAFVTGFFVGYGMLSLSPWIPTAHWHWLPWMLLAGTVVGPISCANGVYRIEKWLLYALLALGVGWMLVPTWEDLEPARWIHQTCFVLYVVGWMAVMEPLGRRSAGPLLPAVLAATLDRDGGHPGPCRQPCDLRRSHWQARHRCCRDFPGQLLGSGAWSSVWVWFGFCHLGDRLPVGGQGQFVQ